MPQSGIKADPSATLRRKDLFTPLRLGGSADFRLGASLVK
jgi:hypothetical protein